MLSVFSQWDTEQTDVSLNHLINQTSEILLAWGLGE